MTKVILNKRECGCFCWSSKAYDECIKRKHEVGEKGPIVSRVDPVAVDLLEEKGSEWCSSSFSNLRVEQYDEKHYRADIREYDGYETLEIKPLLTMDMVKKCGSVQEVVYLLMACDAFVYPNEQLIVPD